MDAGGISAAATVVVLRLVLLPAAGILYQPDADVPLITPQRASCASALYIQNLYVLFGVLDALKGFDWHLHNAGHAARHGVDPMEVEEAVERSLAIVPAKDVGGEKPLTA